MRSLIRRSSGTVASRWKHAALHPGGATHRVEDAQKFCQYPVAGHLDDAPGMLADFRVDKLAAMRLEALARALLVRPINRD